MRCGPDLVGVVLVGAAVGEVAGDDGAAAAQGTAMARAASWVVAICWRR